MDWNIDIIVALGMVKIILFIYLCLLLTIHFLMYSSSCSDGNLFAGTIPSEISNLTNLEYLSISYEDANIPVELGQLIKLKELHLGYSTRQETLPDIFSTMKVLETLTIGPRKNLQGSIPDSLFNMKSLVSVQIFETSLAGELLPFASDKITKLYVVFIAFLSERKC